METSGVAAGLGLISQPWGPGRVQPTLLFWRMCGWQSRQGMFVAACSHGQHLVGCQFCQRVLCSHHNVCRVHMLHVPGQYNCVSEVESTLPGVAVSAEWL